MLLIIDEESRSCLDTNRTPNELQVLTKNTFEGTLKGYRAQDDTVLFDLATETLVMKHTLEEKLNEVVSCQSLSVQL